MKKVINYEKDILFKTNIGEICSISLEHDFTVLEGVLKGEFILEGEYKANELSINKEPFLYRLPLEYDLEEGVLLDTLSYEIENFEYTIKDDCLTVMIDFGIRYEEKPVVPNIPDISEEELNGEEILPKLKDEDYENEEDDEVVVVPVEEEKPEIGDRTTEEDGEVIIESIDEDDEYITYHVHIVKAGETLEAIASEYGTSVEIIKEYNEVDILEEKSKLIIPIANE